LREYIKRIGCGMLQESVWLTPYNPIDLIKTFIKDRNLEGTVIVSDLGHDGSIGDEDVLALIVRIYSLEGLNKRYKELYEESCHNPIDHWMIVKYYSILHDDPQLPFALSPPWWMGERVYKKMKPYIQTRLI
jgi:DNA-binding transcriptional regulator PaaX